MTITFLKRTIWQRIFGICATDGPIDDAGWEFQSGKLTIDLDKIPELTNPGTAVRFEGKTLPSRVLVVIDEEEKYHAFLNQCTHFGRRRLDYVPGTKTLQCCSVNKSTYTFAGEKIHGPNPKPVKVFPVEKDGELLHIRMT